MRIAITSKKGGVTKSTQTKEIAFKYDLTVINLDVDSHIKESFKKLKVENVLENRLIPLFNECVYDFPAGDIFTKFPNTAEILKECDLIIIPTLYGAESVDRAIDTYNKIKPINDNILFVLAQSRDDNAVKDTSQYIEDFTGDEIFLHPIRFSVGMENAEVEGTSIYDIAKKSNKLIKRKYDNGIIKDYDELFKIISEVI
jgi:cellulose biosynthesis protein BcsQ